VLLRDGGPQHVPEQVRAAGVVIGTGAAGGVQGKSRILDAQAADDPGSGPRGQGDHERLAAALGTGGEPVGEQAGGGIGVRLGVRTDDAAADEEPHQPGPDDGQQIRDGGVRDAGQGMERGLAAGAVGGCHERAVQNTECR
jgi:hypothetical protein